MKKRYIIAFVIVAVLAVLGVVGAAVKKNTSEDTLSDDVSGQINITIPELTLYCNDTQVARPRGYTMSMDAFYMRDSLAVIVDGNVKAKINTGGVGINGISYQLRDISAENLLDSNSISDYEEIEGEIDFLIGITDIAKQGEEYILTVIVETAEQENIYYYSRVTEPSENIIGEQAVFAREFSDTTFLHEDAKDLYYYLESDSSFDNTNLGYVTIESNFDQLTWGSLDPTRLAEPEIALKEINIFNSGSAATFELTYQISSGDEGEEDYYNVVEDITVWTYYGTNYVLGYERTVEEIFEASEDTVTSSRVYLGIHEDTDINYVQDESARYLVFVSGDALCSIDTSSKDAVQVFSAHDDTSTDFEIIPVSVDGDGNIEFVVMGYVCYGVHKGESGIAVYSYDSESDKVTEHVFLPCSRPYEVLKEETGRLFYINDGVLYFMLSDSLTYVNMTTKEYGVVVDGLIDGAYAFSDDNTIFAYNTDKALYDSGSITILNLTDKTEYTVDAGDGNKIRVLGFSGSNAVYGIAAEENITGKGGDTVFAMSEIDIISPENEIIKTYSKENVLITNVEISDDMINFKRIKDGEEISDDQLIDNTEKNTAIVEVSYLIDSLKKRTLVLVFETAMSSSSTLSLSSTPDCETSAGRELAIDFQDAGDGNYYVYAMGRLRIITDSFDEAKQTARKYRGTVIDSSGAKAWVFEEHYNDED